MRKVGIKVLKDELSKYVRLAAKGEEIVITDRDEEVAKLVPFKDRSKMSREEKWADWIRRGLVTPAKRPKAPLPPRNPVMTFEELMKDLDASRED